MKAIVFLVEPQVALGKLVTDRDFASPVWEAACPAGVEALCWLTEAWFLAFCTLLVLNIPLPTQLKKSVIDFLM